jgi:hypothetical protein
VLSSTGGAAIGNSVTNHRHYHRGCDHLLIPLDAYARRLWDVSIAGLNAEFAGEDLR